MRFWLCSCHTHRTFADLINALHCAAPSVRNWHEQHMEEVLLDHWLCGDDINRWGSLTYRSGHSHDNRLCLPLFTAETSRAAEQETKTAEAGCSLPCNFLITALIREILAAVCSHHTNVQLSLLCKFWTGVMFTGPLRKMTCEVCWDLWLRP